MVALLAHLLCRLESGAYGSERWARTVGVYGICCAVALDKLERSRELQGKNTYNPPHLTDWRDKLCPRPCRELYVFSLLKCCWISLLSFFLFCSLGGSTSTATCGSRRSSCRQWATAKLQPSSTFTGDVRAIDTARPPF